MDATSLGSAFDLCWPDDGTVEVFGLQLNPFLHFDAKLARNEEDEMSKMAMEMFDFENEADWDFRTSRGSVIHCNRDPNGVQDEPRQNCGG